MENKNKMSLALAAIVCLALIGVLIFISLNKKNVMSDVAESDFSAEAAAKAGDRVSMNYTGRLQDGTVFDSNVDPKFNHTEPFMFTLGAGQVISGWDKGIAGMRVGDKQTLTIPPEDAYGASGIPGVIPPNSTLIFDVELLAIN